MSVAGQKQSEACDTGHTVGAGVPGSDLHQFALAALREVWLLRQRLCLQGRTKQPEENVPLLGTQTLTACSGEQNEDMKTEGVENLQATQSELTRSLLLHTHPSAPHCSTAQR